MRTLNFSIAPGESFGVHGILRANGVDGSSNAFNTLSMEFDDTSAASLEASGVPQTSVIPIPIDIKPGSDPSSINPRNKGVVPVAVLGSTNFDALQVDVSTVRFGPEGALPTHDGLVEDVNDDGFMDMVFHFVIRETGIACGDTEASLTGKAFDGRIVVGTDSVNVLCICDTNSDNVVDIIDIRAISLKRNQPSTGPDDPMDWDQNGVIDLLDARGCQLACTLPRCAVQ